LLSILNVSLSTGGSKSKAVHGKYDKSGRKLRFKPVVDLPYFMTSAEARVISSGTRGNAVSTVRKLRHGMHGSSVPKLKYRRTLENGAEKRKSFATIFSAAAAILEIFKVKEWPDLEIWV